DEHEDEAIHFLGELNGKAIAASRLRWVDGYGKLERICVLKNERGNGYGKQLIQAMEREIVKNGGQKAKLNAQKHAEKFYKQLGYQTVSDQFMDAGIPHVKMVKQLETGLTAIKVRFFTLILILWAGQRNKGECKMSNLLPMLYE